MPQEIKIELPVGRRIKLVAGAEPHREGEYPTTLCRGWAAPGSSREKPGPLIDRIEAVEQNLGTYGMVWYVAYSVDGVELLRLNAAHTAEVHYEDIPDVTGA